MRRHWSRSPRHVLLLAFRRRPGREGYGADRHGAGTPGTGPNGRGGRRGGRGRLCQPVRRPDPDRRDRRGAARARSDLDHRRGRPDLQFHPARGRDLPRRLGDGFRRREVLPGTDRRRRLDQRAEGALCRHRKRRNAGSETVVVRIKNPDGKFLWKLGWGDAVIVSPGDRGHQQDKAGGHRALPVRALEPGRPGRTGVL